ncbi:MAG: PDZ domain-containing protein [Desulfurobacteriaceae bacterium]
MQQKAVSYTIYTVVILFSFSLASFISALVKFKTPPCFNFKAPSAIENKKTLTTPKSKISRKGFFLSHPKPKEVLPEEEKNEEIETDVLQGYKLTGTVVCGECGHSIAIIRDKSAKKSFIISEGQELAGFRVVKIYPDKVLLSRGKKKVILTLGKNKKGNKNLTLHNKIKRTFTVKRSEIMEEIASGEFLKYINIVPSKDPEGLKVNYVNPRSFIYKLGIRPGDVIVSINDIRIRTPEDSFSAFEQLKNSDSITITVLRRGKKVRLRYEIE